MRITHKTNSIMGKPLNGSLEECFKSPYCALFKNKKRNKTHVDVRNCWSRKGAMLFKKKKKKKRDTENNTTRPFQKPYRMEEKKMKMAMRKNHKDIQKH